MVALLDANPRIDGCTSLGSTVCADTSRSPRFPSTVRTAASSVPSRGFGSRSGVDEMTARAAALGIPDMHSRRVLRIPSHGRVPGAQRTFHLAVALGAQIRGVEERQVDIAHVRRVEPRAEALIPHDTPDHPRTDPPIGRIDDRSRVEQTEELRRAQERGQLVIACAGTTGWSSSAQ